MYRGGLLLLAMFFTAKRLYVWSVNATLYLVEHSSLHFFPFFLDKLTTDPKDSVSRNLMIQGKRKKEKH